MGVNASIEGSNPSFSAPQHGEVSEGPKERDWKSRTCGKVRGGFKSRPLRRAWGKPCFPHGPPSYGEAAQGERYGVSAVTPPRGGCRRTEEVKPHWSVPTARSGNRGTETRSRARE